MSINISLPKFTRLNKTVLIVTASVLLFLAIVAVGIVQNVRQERAEADRTAAVTARAEAEQKAMSARIMALEADSKKLTAEVQLNAASCSEFRKLDADRTITAKINVPAYCLGR